MTRLKLLLIWIGLLAFGIAVVVGVEAIIPASIWNALTIPILLIALAWFLYSWFRWQRRQRGDGNELEYLEELAQEHAEGKRDHKAGLEMLIRTSTVDWKSPANAKRLEKMRRALDS